MLLLISELIGRPVITFDEAEPIGTLQDPIIDPANGKLCGFFIGHGVLQLKRAIIASVDIVSYDQSRLVINQDRLIHKSDDEPKIREILAKKIPVLHATVLTESGTNLGRANDLLFDTELNMIVKYYVHGLIHDRIIAAEHVISIEKRGIIVDDAAPSAGAVAAEAEPT